jgi:hypothetical protein
LVLCVGDSRLPPAELSHLLSIGMDAAARSAEFMRAALISNMNQLSVAAAEAALALSTPEVK